MYFYPFIYETKEEKKEKLEPLYLYLEDSLQYNLPIEKLKNENDEKLFIIKLF